MSEPDSDTQHKKIQPNSFKSGYFLIYRKQELIIGSVGQPQSLVVISANELL